MPTTETQNVDFKSIDDFMNWLTERRKTGDDIVKSSLQFKCVKDNFLSLADHFTDRESTFRNFQKNLDQKIQELNERIKSHENESLKQCLERKSMELESETLRTFKRLVAKELEREEFYKQKAMEVYLAHCVEVGVASTSTDF